MRLMLDKCNCDWNDLSRIPRSWWMRLFPSHRLYFCAGCKARVFARRSTIEGSPNWWRSGAMLMHMETRSAALDG